MYTCCNNNMLAKFYIITYETKTLEIEMAKL